MARRRSWLILFILLWQYGIPAAALSNTSRLPDTVLWAWQRAEDLSALDPNEFGVAYFACRALLAGDTVRVFWRDQTLRLAPGTVVVPVVRIDTDSRLPPALSARQLEILKKILGRLARIPNAAQIQIDFDAVQTERSFYRRLLREGREVVPSEMPISITALASWCLFDKWIENLPVDETVPMMFSLGGDRRKIIDYFRAHNDYLVSGCCKALGIALEEPDVSQLMIKLAQGRKMPVRIYVFTTRAWNDKKIDAVRALLSKPKP